MKYFYRIGNVTIFANKCARNGMAISKDEEIESASFTDGTIIRVLKPGDVLHATIEQNNEN